MKKWNENSFCEYLDTVFLIAQEVWEDHGEDSFYCANNSNSAIVSVYDGCGGLGSRVYESFKGHTGAYMASRIVSGAVHDWYHEEYSKSKTIPDDLVSGIDRYIKKAYRVCSSYAKENLRIRGSMVRDFPTTAAIALAEKNKKGIMLHVLWAGDSRVYLLDKDGLAQLTEDDTDSEDAFDNLTSDGVLTNLLSSDGKYEIHYKKILLDRPAIVFAATDGCFGYIPTPMEFEYIILKLLIESKTPEIFKKRLKGSFETYAGDDFAFGLMSFSFGSFNNIRKELVSRLECLENNYLVELKNSHEDGVVLQLWGKYRKSYERYLKPRRMKSDGRNN